MDIELKLPIELINLAIELIDQDVENTHATIDHDDLKNDNLMRHYHDRARLYWILRNAKRNAQLEQGKAL